MSKSVSVTVTALALVAFVLTVMGLAFKSWEVDVNNGDTVAEFGPFTGDLPVSEDQAGMSPIRFSFLECDGTVSAGGVDVTIHLGDFGFNCAKFGTFQFFCVFGCVGAGVLTALAAATAMRGRPFKVWLQPSVAAVSFVFAVIGWSVGVSMILSGNDSAGAPAVHLGAGAILYACGGGLLLVATLVAFVSTMRPAVGEQALLYKATEGY